MKSSDTLDLSVTLNIPLTAGNGLQGLQGAVAWVFTAEYIPGGGGGGEDALEQVFSELDRKEAAAAELRSRLERLRQEKPL